MKIHLRKIDKNLLRDEYSYIYTLSFWENVSDANLEKVHKLHSSINRCNQNVKLILEFLERKKALESAEQRLK